METNLRWFVVRSLESETRTTVLIYPKNPTLGVPPHWYGVYVHPFVRFNKFLYPSYVFNDYDDYRLMVKKIRLPFVKGPRKNTSTPVLWSLVFTTRVKVRFITKRPHSGRFQEKDEECDTTRTFEYHSTLCGYSDSRTHSYCVSSCGFGWALLVHRTLYFFNEIFIL